jgi:hypothetical protein
MPTPLTDADKVLRNDTGKAIVEKLDDIANAISSGVPDNLSDLGDVDMSSPTSNQALVYNPDTHKWENAMIPQTGTIEDVAIASFSDGADDVPVSELIVDIEARQDLHGYDKPWVGGAGKNKLPNTATSQTVCGVTYTVNSDGSVTANGTSTDWGDGFVIGTAALEPGTYILSGETINEFTRASTPKVTDIVADTRVISGYSLLTFSDYTIKVFSSISPAHEETIDDLILSHGVDTVDILKRFSWVPKYPVTFVKKYYVHIRNPFNGPLSDIRYGLKNRR